jgi:hypothetical protein
VPHFVQTEPARKTEYISEDYRTQKPTETLQNCYVFGNCDFFHLRDAAANRVFVDPDPAINQQKKGRKTLISIIFFTSF